MKKLLPEMLRYIANENEEEVYSDDIIVALCKEFGVCENKSSYAVDLRNCLKAIADEIEKYYIPRPRFDDGEAVETIQGWLDRWYLPRPVFEDGEPVNVNTIEDMLCYQVADDGEWTATFADGTQLEGKAGELLKLPEPEVLDADGVPIKVGDTVWVIHSGYEHHITRVENGKVYGSDWQSVELGEPIEPDCLTHTHPYYTADNVRIVPGMKVYGGDGRAWVVDGIDQKYLAHPISGHNADRPRSRRELKPEWLTTKEPDTQVKIDADATMPPRDYYAKHIGHDVRLKDNEEIFCAVIADLLRRQRELDGRA